MLSAVSTIRVYFTFKKFINVFKKAHPLNKKSKYVLKCQSRSMMMPVGLHRVAAAFRSLASSCNVINRRFS
jgi:hypothetical protein